MSPHMIEVIIGSFFVLVTFLLIVISKMHKSVVTISTDWAYSSREAIEQLCKSQIETNKQLVEITKTQYVQGA